MQIPFEKPKIVLPLTKNIKIVNVIGQFLLVLLWAFSIWMYINAPSKVPIHFNIKGDVDSYGDKFFLLLLPLITTAVYFFLKYLSDKPYLFNYSYVITKDNYESAYKNTANMMHILRLLIVILFIVIQYMVCAAIQNTNAKFGTTILIITLLAILIIPITITAKKNLKK